MTSLLFLLAAFALSPAPLTAQTQAHDAPTVTQPDGTDALIDDLRSSGAKALRDTALASAEGLAFYAELSTVLAASHDIEKARLQYLDMVRELALFSIQRNEVLPSARMLENALTLADEDDDKSLIHFMLAWSLAQSPDAFQRARAGAEFAQADKLETKILRDEMLLHYARWAERDGYSSVGDDGKVRTEADHERALLLYDELAAKSDDVTKVELARKAAENIRKASVSVAIPNAFRNGSQPQFNVRWRNCKEVSLAIHQVDPSSIGEAAIDTSTSAIAGKITIEADNKPVRSLSLTTAAPRPYTTVNQAVRLDELMLPGVYVVSASSGELASRELLIISDSVLTLKVGRGELLAFASNASSGEPIDGALVLLWTKDPASGVWRRAESKTSSDGVALFTVAELGSGTDISHRDIVAFMTKDQQNAVALLRPSPKAAQAEDIWTAVSLTDARVYKQGDTVRAKVLLRHREGSAMRVPQSVNVSCAIHGPQGFSPLENIVTTDEAGTASAEFALPANAPTGAYFLEVFRGGDESAIGEGAQFFVSEQRDASCNISIQLRQQEKADAYKVGETIRGSVHVVSPYGGQLASHEVEIIVEECSYDIVAQKRTGPWRLISTQKLRTDSIGEAGFAIQTTASTENDFQFRILARSLDKSTYAGSTRTYAYATRQDLYAKLSTDRVLYENGKDVTLNLATVSASGKATPSNGTLRLMRESWQEVWVDRRGREISGEQMQALRRRSGSWFSFGQSAGDYVLKTQGYTTSIVAEIPISTDKRGQAAHVWENVQPGYYRLVWIREGRRGTLLSNECQIWVSEQDSEVKGYRPSSVKLITNSYDSQTNAHDDMVLVAVPSSSQSVLLVSGADSIQNWRVMKLGSMAQLVKLQGKYVGESVSYLEASCVSDERLGRALSVIQTPESQSLGIGIAADKLSYEPGQNAEWTLTVRDGKGQLLKGARVAFWLRQADDTPEARQGSGIDKLFPPLRESYSIVTATSIDTKPFFQPVSTGSLKADAQAQPQGRQLAVREGGSAYDNTLDACPGEQSGSGVWFADLVSDEEGIVRISHAMPATIAAWEAIAVASSADGSAGFAILPTQTAESLSVSMNAPESIFTGDTLRLKTAVSNNLPEESAIFCDIQCKGIDPVTAPFKASYLMLQARSSASLKWDVSFNKAGHGSFIARAKSAQKSLSLLWDMLVKDDPRTVSRGNSYLLEQGELVLPEAAANDSLQYSISASAAHVAISALPKLLENPSSGSTEAAGRIATIQSLRRMFERMRFDNAAIEGALIDCGAEKYARTRMDDDMARITKSQNGNGAWGWMNAEETNAFDTAFIMLMLNLCDGETRSALEPALEKARAFAATELLSGQQDLDTQVLLLYGLASRELGQTRPSRLEARALVNLIRSKEKLSPFALACLTICASQYGFEEEAQSLGELLKSQAVTETDSSGHTMLYWKGSAVQSAVSASDVESTAVGALAMLASEGPTSETLEQAMRFIYSNLKGSSWDGPRETALCILAFRDFAAFTKETDNSARCELRIGDTLLCDYDYGRDFRLGAPEQKQHVLTAGDLEIGKISIVRKEGESPVFFSIGTNNSLISAESFSTLDGARVSRSYMRNVQVPTLLNGYDEEIMPLGPEDSLRSGERIEVVITLELDADMPRLMLVEPRPSFSAARPHERFEVRMVNLSNAELAPKTVEFDHSAESMIVCIENIPAGQWEIRYPLRVDFEGSFLAPSAELFIPQRPSQKAVSGWRIVQCVSGE
ncbi:MAG: hypothetical protein JW942_05720 [Opitutales bacterium]|nr:hypothetical protein [Opitutales bacterium]